MNPAQTRSLPGGLESVPNSPSPLCTKTKNVFFRVFFGRIHGYRRLDGRNTTELSRDKAEFMSKKCHFGQFRGILEFGPIRGSGLGSGCGANVGHRQVRLSLSAGGELPLACGGSYRGE